ncbi:MAG: esterase [Gammaproteobacteria bacterium]|nr:esterase [Gammaproteobacteria bacterium]
MAFAGAVLLLVAGGADGATPDSAPAASNVPGAQTPSIHADGRVTFTLEAPKAGTVELAGGDGLGQGPFPMTRQGKGAWSVTIPAPVPGFHYYWFMLDGVRVNDPGSRTYFGYSQETSGIEIPQPGADFYAIRSVPHGQVREHWYLSSVTGEWRRALVYTPAGYDDHPTQRYPLLLLQHGMGEDESGWTRQGKAQFILDNLIAAHKAVPMIVVMDRGYADPPGAAPFALSDNLGLAAIRTAFTRFEAVVMEDLLPSIDRSYRTIPDQAHRAMAGLSMGGMQTLFIALRHLDTFAYIASLSGPVSGGSDANQSFGASLGARFDVARAYDGAFADPAGFNARVKLLWMGAGSAESPRLRTSIEGAVEALHAAGVQVVYYQSPGTAHEWQTWRNDLNDLAPRLFR